MKAYQRLCLHCMLTVRLLLSASPTALSLPPPHVCAPCRPTPDAVCCVLSAHSTCCLCAQFAGAMARVARSPLFKASFPDDAARYLAKAIKAWDYLATKAPFGALCYHFYVG